MQKTYLSREMTRAMALDHPIGDPFGGAAYGERRDPVSAVISIASMASTYAAAGTFAAMTLTQGLVFAGAAIGLAGNITGNKTLSKIGMVTGLAGGVGMLAEWATGSTIGGTLGETFGSSSSAAANAPASGLSQSAAPGAQVPVVDGVATSMPVDMGGPALATDLGPLNAPSVATGPLNTPGAATGPLNAPGSGIQPLNAAPVDYSLPTAPGAPGAPGLKIGAGTGTNLSSAGRAAPGFTDSLKAGNYGDALSAAGSNIMDLAKSNPGAAMMMGNAASGVADWLSGKTDAEIAALEAQVGFADARAMQIQEEIARERRRRTNVNRNVQSAGPGIQVNPNASIQQPWAQQQQPAPGLIAGARMGG